MAESREAEKVVRLKEKREVEKLRALLCELVESHGATNETVIELSSTLDMAILEMMANKNNSYSY